MFIGQLEIQIGPRDFLLVTSVLYELYDSFASIINEMGWLTRSGAKSGPTVPHLSRKTKQIWQFINERNCEMWFDPSNFSAPTAHCWPVNQQRCCAHSALWVGKNGVKWVYYCYGFGLMKPKGGPVITEIWQVRIAAYWMTFPCKSLKIKMTIYVWCQHFF